MEDLHLKQVWQAIHMHKASGKELTNALVFPVGIFHSGQVDKSQ